jgi:hypothetical protein
MNSFNGLDHPDAPRHFPGNFLKITRSPFLKSCINEGNEASLQMGDNNHEGNYSTITLRRGGLGGQALSPRSMHVSFLLCVITQNRAGKNRKNRIVSVHGVPPSGVLPH